jgi:hypothetical protein
MYSESDKLSGQNYVNIFNDHFVEFVQDIQNVFPTDTDIATAKNTILLIKKVNPKMIVKIWKTYIVSKYEVEIEKGDLEFFINKDYSNDVAQAEYSDKIMDSINRLREPVKQMSVENQLKTMKYIQNLTKLSQLC